MLNKAFSYKTGQINAHLISSRMLSGDEVWSKSHYCLKHSWLFRIMQKIVKTKWFWNSPIP